MTLTQDRRSALIGGCPLFRGLDALGPPGAHGGGASRSTFRPTA